jgi:hypothetical protein
MNDVPEGAEGAGSVVPSGAETPVLQGYTLVIPMPMAKINVRNTHAGSIASEC